MSADENKKNLGEDCFYPPFAVPTVLGCGAISAIYWKDILDLLQTPTLEIVYGFFVVISLGCYSMHWLFYFSSLKISGDNLNVPFTNANGCPEWFGFKKRNVKISTIKRIIIYREKFSVSFAFLAENSQGNSDARISIFAADGVNFQISYNFYGQEEVDRLTSLLWAKNDTIQIVESSSSFGA